MVRGRRVPLGAVPSNRRCRCAGSLRQNWLFGERRRSAGCVGVPRDTGSVTTTGPSLLRETEAKSQEADPLMRARAALLSPDLPPLKRPRVVPVASLHDAGWTPETYGLLARLAEHALTAGAHAASLTNDAIRHLVLPHYYGDETRRATLWASVVTRHMFRLGEFAIWRGVALPEMTAWLTVYASAVDRDESTTLRFGVEEWGRASAVPLAAWSVAAGDMGAFAYAAGLTPVEAQQRAAVGTLDADDLRMLAALRGWRLPATSA